MDYSDKVEDNVTRIRRWLPRVVDRRLAAHGDEPLESMVVRNAVGRSMAVADMARRYGLGLCLWTGGDILRQVADPSAIPVPAIAVHLPDCVTAWPPRVLGSLMEYLDPFYIHAYQSQACCRTLVGGDIYDEFGRKRVRWPDCGPDAGNPVIQPEAHVIKIAITTERLINGAKHRMLLEAGFWLYCLSYANEYESCGGTFGAGAALEECVPRPPDDRLLPIMQDYVTRIEETWRYTVEGTFVRMELMPKDWSSALYKMLAACMGHGIGLEDDYSENIDNYSKYENHALDTSPAHIDSYLLEDLAYQQILASGVFPRVTCKLCEQQVVASMAHAHQGTWVGEECGCWGNGQQWEGG